MENRKNRIIIRGLFYFWMMLYNTVQTKDKSDNIQAENRCRENRNSRYTELLRDLRVKKCREFCYTRDMEECV